MTSELLVAGAANLDRMMYVERIPEQGETIMALNYEEPVSYTHLTLPTILLV